MDLSSPVTWARRRPRSLTKIIDCGPMTPDVSMVLFCFWFCIYLFMVLSFPLFPFSFFPFSLFPNWCAINVNFHVHGLESSIYLSVCLSVCLWGREPGDEAIIALNYYNLLIRLWNVLLIMSYLSVTTQDNPLRYNESYTYRPKTSEVIVHSSHNYSWERLNGIVQTPTCLLTG